MNTNLSRAGLQRIAESPKSSGEICLIENKTNLREGWILLSVLAVLMVVGAYYLTSTYRMMSQVEMTRLMAVPITDYAPAKRAAKYYNGQMIPGLEPKSDNEVHLKSFDYVWKTIKDSYWEEDFGGVDWDQAKAELRPKVENAKDIKEVRKVMMELLSKLEKSHFAIIPGSAYKATQISRKGSADSGLTFRYSQQKVLVSAVRPGSDAEEQGVKPGWQIIGVGDQDVPSFLDKAKSYKGVIRLETLIALRFGNSITGEVGETKTCKFVDSDGNEKSVNLTLSDPPGKKVKFGNLPSMRIDMESKLLDSNIGYFRFNGFFDPVRLMPAFRKAVKEYQDADGLIIDIRGNGGGMVGMTMGMASPLTDKPAPLGVMKMKGNEMKLALFKNARPYQKKIAILVDEASASASEIYAGGLQDLKIARVFGRRTAGLSLPSTVEKLPNGDGFQYAFANYTSASGRILEGNGVTPDETIVLTPKNLANEIDPTLKRAAAWIHAQDK